MHPKSYAGVMKGNFSKKTGLTKYSYEGGKSKVAQTYYLLAAILPTTLEMKLPEYIRC
jgi:hypothetical protein